MTNADTMQRANSNDGGFLRRGRFDGGASSIACAPDVEGIVP